MALYQKLTMLAKDMFLKKINFNFLVLVLFLFLLLSKSPQASEIEKVITYIKSLNNFSSSFIQNNYEEISEGKIYIGKERIRIEYLKPSKILIILDKDKAMYYNYELNEDEFFNPKDTTAIFFFEIFNNPDFLLNSKNSLENKNLIVIKNTKIEDIEYKLKLYFEFQPLIIRKIEVISNDILLEVSFFDHKFNEEFSKKFFKLINPELLN